MDYRTLGTKARDMTLDSQSQDGSAMNTMKVCFSFPFKPSRGVPKTRNANTNSSETPIWTKLSSARSGRWNLLHLPPERPVAPTPSVAIPISMRCSSARRRLHRFSLLFQIIYSVSSPAPTRSIPMPFAMPSRRSSQPNIRLRKNGNTIFAA